MAMNEVRLPYQYRWIYASIISLVITLTSYYYDIALILSEIKSLHLEEGKLVQQIKHVQLLHNSINPIPYPPKDLQQKPYSMHAFLPDIMLLIRQSGLQIKSFNLNLALTHASETNLHVVFQGDYSQFIAFMASIVKQNHRIFLANFSSVLSNENKLIFSLDMTLINRVNAYFSSDNYAVMFATTHNPFCVANITSRMNQQNQSMTLQNTSITTIKMLSYFQYGSWPQALLKLPNGLLLNCKQGSVVGKERARVLVIKPNYLLMVLPNKKFMTLKREEYEINVN